MSSDTESISEEKMDAVAANKSVPRVARRKVPPMDEETAAALVSLHQGLPSRKEAGVFKHRLFSLPTHDARKRVKRADPPLQPDAEVEHASEQTEMISRGSIAEIIMRRLGKLKPGNVKDHIIMHAVPEEASVEGAIVGESLPKSDTIDTGTEIPVKQLPPVDSSPPDATVVIRSTIKPQGAHPTDSSILNVSIGDRVSITSGEFQGVEGKAWFRAYDDVFVVKHAKGLSSIRARGLIRLPELPPANPPPEGPDESVLQELCKIHMASLERAFRCPISRARAEEEEAQDKLAHSDVTGETMNALIAAWTAKKEARKDQVAKLSASLHYTRDAAAAMRLFL